MILDLLDEAALGAEKRYRAFILALEGAFARVGGTMPQGDARAFSALRSTGTALAQHYLDEEITSLRNDLVAIHERATRAAQDDILGVSGPSDVSEASEEYAAWFWQELGAQVWRDVNALTLARRKSDLASRVTGSDIDPQFFFTDALGRRYQSTVFVPQLYRHTLVTFAVQSYAEQAASLGAETATVTHPDPEHEFQGLPVALVPGVGEGYRLLTDILDQVFHPNSRAFLLAEAG